VSAGGVRDRLPPALSHRDFVLLTGANTAMQFGNQMAAVAIGWQVYQISKDPLDLGLIGLAEFIPLLLLALPAGHLSDRVPRKFVFAGALLLQMAMLAGLTIVTFVGTTEVWPFFALASIVGVVTALTGAARAIYPNLVPPELMASAMAIRSTGMQAGFIAGPAIGGLLFAIRPELPYLVAGGATILAFFWTLPIHEPKVEREPESPGLGSLLAGVRFIRHTPVLFGAISLDLFAVLFGGAVALLPAFAQDVLHVGPTGLGVLRAATAVGALVGAVLLARKPLGSNAGAKLLVCVGIFGASIVVFGLSQWFALSVIALAISGAADMVSMNIRSTTVGLVTPDEVRGRVNAVEMVFISASNELGAFESGVVARIFGLVNGVVLGGVATMAIAATWSRVFPELAQVDRLENLRPVAVAK
jgi:MFS family permease